MHGQSRWVVRLWKTLFLKSSSSLYRTLIISNICRDLTITGHSFNCNDSVVIFICSFLIVRMSGRWNNWSFPCSTWSWFRDKVSVYTRSWSCHGLGLHKVLVLTWSWFIQGPSIDTVLIYTRFWSWQDLGLDKVSVYTRSSRHRWELSRVKGPFLESSISLQNYNLSIAAAWSIRNSNFNDILCSPAIQTHFSYCVFLCLAELDQSSAGGGKY